LGQEVRLKYLPKLHFREDPAIEQGQRVEEILRGLHRADRGGGEDEP
jgi:ribosome-binding factor A